MSGPPALAPDPQPRAIAPSPVTEEPDVDRHPIDALSLTFGLIFVAIAAAALTGQRIELPTEWILPAVLVATGGGILAVSILRGRSRREKASVQPADGGEEAEAPPSST